MEWQTAPPPASKLPPGEVHVWSFRLDVEDEALARLRGWLSAEETARAARFRFERDRRRFVVRRGLLRRLLAGYLDAAPENLAFTTGKHSRPALAAAPNLDFNTSHSGEIGLLAVACQAQIGVDIERLRPQADLPAFARRFFSPVEQAQLLALPDAERLPAFYRVWTRKEAYVKALGIGLSAPLDQFDVSLAAEEPARLLAARGGLPADFQLLNLDVAAGYAGALCLPPGDWRVQLWRLDVNS